MLSLPLVCVTASKEINCESLNFIDWGEDWGQVGRVKSCIMDDLTSIEEPNVKISSAYDRYVKGLNFAHNKQIFNLPDNVAENFPNLLAYSAWDCSVKEITNNDFKGLTKLIRLALDDNQIEKVASKAFDDLENLRTLWLGKNKESSYNGFVNYSFSYF